MDPRPHRLLPTVLYLNAGDELPRAPVSHVANLIAIREGVVLPYGIVHDAADVTGVPAAAPPVGMDNGPSQCPRMRRPHLLSRWPPCDVSVVTTVSAPRDTTAASDNNRESVPPRCMC